MEVIEKLFSSIKILLNITGTNDTEILIMHGENHVLSSLFDNRGVI